jgi:hypothetical protein
MRRNGSSSPDIFLFIGGIIVLLLLILPELLKTHHGRCHSPQNSCIANMKQLESAIEQFQLEHPTVTNRPLPSDLFGTNLYIKVAPTCHQNGFYQWTASSDSIRCTVHGSLTNLLPRNP